MKATPITNKAKCSPFKMNAALVQNDAIVHKGFIDVKKAFGDGVTESLQSVDNFNKVLGTGKKKDIELDTTPTRK